MADSDPSLMPLELFVLFCVRIGFGTSYAIENEMGVSVGASSPTLKRLEAKGFVGSIAGPRNRQSYSVTKKGETVLRKGMSGGLKVFGRLTPRGAYETLPRVIFLSWVMGDLGEARASLDKVALSLTLKQQRANSTAEECRTILNAQEKDPMRERVRQRSPEYVAAVYRLIVSVAESSGTQLRSLMLTPLSDLIGELPANPDLGFREKSDETTRA